MDIQTAKQIICAAVWRYIAENRLVGCYRCETLVRGKEILESGRFCYSCEDEVYYEEVPGFKDKIVYSGY